MNRGISSRLGRLRSRRPAGLALAAIALAAGSPAHAGDVWETTRLNINLLPPNVVAYNGETKIYEAGGSITVGSGTYFTGSQVVLAAGDTISFLPGFLAQQGSSVTGIIDADHNGISDYLESVDTDGDGYFDALESYLGTRNGAQSHHHDIDVNRDGVFDAVEDVMTLGTPSALGVSEYPTSDGYRSSLGSEIFPYGTSYSVTVSDGGSLFDRFLSGYLPSWFAENLHLDFSYTYEYYNFQGYYAGIFVWPQAQGDYGLYAMDPWLGWVPLVEFTRAGSQGYTFYSPLYDDVWQMPQFLQLVKYGSATPTSVPGGFDILSILGAGEVSGNRLSVSLPQVLGLPASVANAVDWADILQPGGGSWNLDLDGDGVNEVTLDALNLEGKVSIEVASTRVEIEAHIGGGVYVGIGDFKVGRDANGNLSLQLPDFIAGTDGLLRLHFAETKAAYDVAVDLNRDGAIEFDKSDATATNDPYVFWVNNDHDSEHTVDGSDSEEDDLPPPSLGGDAVIDHLQYKRDLEDLSRIWLDLDEFSSAHSLTDTSISLRVRIKESRGYPSINLFEAVEANGGRQYLSDEGLGNAQLAGDYGNELCSASYGNYIQTVPRRAWESLPSSKIVHLLFEGQVKGEGELLFYFEKNGQTVYSFDPIYLKLEDVKEMYETWTVGDVGPGGIVSSAWPAPAADQSGGSSLSPPDPNRPAELDYIMFVHGWNLSPFDKDWFASTAFKRLWHHGYKGRFGAFRWPTFHSPSLDLRLHFDSSEERAWHSGRPLATLIEQLSTKYSVLGQSKIRLYAHSMGNVVAAEALRSLPVGNHVQVYISAQAALSAHAWDNTTLPKGLASDTPDVYGHYWKSGTTLPPHQWDNFGHKEYMHATYMPANVRYVNHYNELDWAFKNPVGWETNQWLKPDIGYDYSHRFPEQYSSFARQPILSVWTDLSFPGDKFEIFSYAADSISEATATEGNVNGVFQLYPAVDLNQIFGFGSAHKGHSAQFRSTIQKRWMYWRQALDDMAIIYP